MKMMQQLLWTRKERWMICLINQSRTNPAGTKRTKIGTSHDDETKCRVRTENITLVKEQDDDHHDAAAVVVVEMKGEVDDLLINLS